MNDDNDKKDLVLRHIKGLLDSGRLMPGDRLPAERRLSVTLHVSRSYVREAYEALDKYGIATTFPQSGTVLADHSLFVLRNLLDNLLNVSSFDFLSLVKTRILLESEAVRQCALMRDEASIGILRTALEDFENNAGNESRVEKDLAYHLAIARSCRNQVIYSLLLIIVPDVLSYYRRLNVCAVPEEEIIREHRAIFEAIVKGDPDAAEASLKTHLAASLDFAEGYNELEIPRVGI